MAWNQAVGFGDETDEERKYDEASDFHRGPNFVQ